MQRVVGKAIAALNSLAKTNCKLNDDLSLTPILIA